MEGANLLPLKRITGENIVRPRGTAAPGWERGCRGHDRQDEGPASNPGVSAGHGPCARNNGPHWVTGMPTGPTTILDAPG